MVGEAGRRFHADMVAGAERLKREIGYNPTRFTRMVGEMGGVEAARHLLRGSRHHVGVEVSVEAFVILPWYRGLFSEDELATAERRLGEHRFDVERFLREAGQRPPAWVTPDTSQGD